MANTETCLACGADLPDNFESLEACQACGADLWESDSDDGELNGKIIGAALGAAILGTVIWVGIGLGSGREFGWIAWGIGALVGWVTTKVGGAGMKPAVLAAVLTACSIGGGRVGVIKYMTGEWIEESITSEEFRRDVTNLKLDAAEYANLKGEVDDEALIKFLTQHDYMSADGSQDFGDSDLAEVRQNLIPMFERIGAPGGEMDYIDSVRSEMAAELGVWKLLKEGSGLVDLIFLVLGIGTAFKLVLGRS